MFLSKRANLTLWPPTLNKWVPLYGYLSNQSVKKKGFEFKSIGIQWGIGSKDSHLWYKPHWDGKKKPITISSLLKSSAKSLGFGNKGRSLCRKVALNLSLSLAPAILRVNESIIIWDIPQKTWGQLTLFDLVYQKDVTWYLISAPEVLLTSTHALGCPITYEALLHSLLLGNDVKDYGTT